MSDTLILIYEIDLVYPNKKKPVKTLRVFPNVFKYYNTLEELNRLCCIGEITEFISTPLTKNSKQLGNIKEIIKRYDSIPTDEFALLINYLGGKSND